MRNICSIIVYSLFFSISSATEVLGREMNIHDFMEDYTEIAMKKAKKGNSKYLERVLKEIPNMALPDAKEKWTEISQRALETKEYKKSCSTCHKEFKKPYKKTYRKRLVSIPDDLILLFKEIQ